MIDLAMLSLIFFGMVFVLLSGLGQLIVLRKSTNHYLFATFFLSLAIILADQVNIRADISLIIPSLTFMNVVPIYLLGPLFHIIFRGERDWTKHDLWPFVVPLLAAGLMLPFYLLPAFDKQQIFRQGMITGDVALSHYIAAAGMVYSGLFFLGRTVLFARRVSLALIWQDKVNRFVSYTLATSLLVVASMILGLISRDFFYFRLASSMLGLGAATFYVLSFRYPELIGHLQSAFNATQDKRSHIHSIDIEASKSALLRAMCEERIYRRPDLTLSDLASQINLSANQASQLINGEVGKTFNQFITDYRLGDAKQLLQESNSTRTILEIAYISGFNSLTTFNRSFKAAVGVSPRDYRSRSGPK